jgi:hypothetical protein
VATKIGSHRRVRSRPPESGTIPLVPQEDAGATLCPTPEQLGAGQHAAKAPAAGTHELEEPLVTDARSGLTPSQMVDLELALLLGLRRLATAAEAAGEKHGRRTSGSREGAGPGSSLTLNGRASE